MIANVTSVGSVFSLSYDSHETGVIAIFYPNHDAGF